MTRNEKIETLVLRVHDLALELDDAKRAYLVETGWKDSSDYPDSRLRWSKDVAGKRITAATDEAVKMQRDFLDWD